MFGNRVTFYQHNFLDCQRNPDIKPEWIYAIWYSDESGWSGQYHIASFRTEEQLKKFAKKIGFKYQWNVCRSDGYKEGRISVIFESESADKEPSEEWADYYNMAFHSDNPTARTIGLKWLDGHFKDKCQAYSINSENLKKAKKIKALSNGSIVDCLFINDGQRVKFYRCNPNAKKFYHPLSLEEHIKYHREHGSF